MYGWEWQESKGEKERRRKKDFDPLKSFLWENLVTSVSGAQILNNPWVWYSYNITHDKNDESKTQRRTQAIGLGIMIGKNSPDS